MAKDKADVRKRLIEQERFTHAIACLAAELVRAASLELRVYNDGEIDMSTALGDSDACTGAAIEDVATAVRRLKAFRRTWAPAHDRPGMYRRVDRLGRLALPRELRETLGISFGDELEFFTRGAREIVLVKRGRDKGR